MHGQVFENVFAFIKNNNRVMVPLWKNKVFLIRLFNQVRRDKNIKNYFSFVYISMLEIHIRHAFTNKLEKYVK